MDILLSKSRLRIERAKKYKSREAFADAYDAAFSSAGEASILRRYRNYENTKKTEYLDLKDAANVCDLLGIDLDYLAGRIDGITHEEDIITKTTGLSHESIQLLKSHPQIVAFLNYLSRSESADEIERLIVEGLMSEAIDTPDRRRAYNELQNPSDDEAKLINSTLFYNMGATIVSARDKRNSILSSLITTLQKVFDDFFTKVGEEKRYQLLVLQKRTASGAGGTESGQQGR